MKKSEGKNIGAGPEYSKELEFLSDSSVYLLGSSSYEELFPFIADKLSELTDALIVVSEYDRSINSTVVRAVKMSKNKEALISRILGSRLTGLTLAFDERVRKKFISGKLGLVKGGLYELSFNRIPEKICRLIEKALSVKLVYAMAFVVEQDFLGTVVVMTHKNVQLPNIQMIEAFVNQSAMALKRKNIERQLLETQKRLEKEKALLQQMEQKKDEFIGIASHELKTPLTSVKVYSQLLQKSMMGFKSDSVHAKPMMYINNLCRELNKMELLIRDMLDVSKIEKGKLRMDKRKVDVDKVVRNTIAEFRLIGATHEIVQRGELHATVIGDEDRIQQVITNLLDNAVKYSPEAHEVIVLLTRKNKEVVISVRDFGVGIPADQKEKIFDRYFRVNEKIQQGFGLGLYISSQIIKNHGGRIWVDSKLGKGSTFSVALPVLS